MINAADNEIILRCECHSTDHIALLIHEPEADRPDHDDWYLTVMLGDDTFWKRLGRGLHYIFRPSTLGYGRIAELVLRNKDVDALALFITNRRFLKRES